MNIYFLVEKLGGWEERVEGVLILCCTYGILSIMSLLKTTSFNNFVFEESEEVNGRAD